MTLSNEARSSMFSEETSDGLLVLLTIDHAGITAPIRLVNNNVDIKSRGEDFLAFPFEIILPEISPPAPGSSGKDCFGDRIRA